MRVKATRMGIIDLRRVRKDEVFESEVFCPDWMAPADAESRRLADKHASSRKASEIASAQAEIQRLQAKLASLNTVPAKTGKAVKEDEDSIV